MNLREELDKTVLLKELGLFDKVKITERIPYVEKGEIAVGQFPNDIFEITEIGKRAITLSCGKRTILITNIKHLEKIEVAHGDNK